MQKYSEDTKQLATVIAGILQKEAITPGYTPQGGGYQVQPPLVTPLPATAATTSPAAAVKKASSLGKGGKWAIAGVLAALGVPYAYKAIQRMNWGNMADQKMGPERAQEELAKEYKRRIAARDEAMDAYKGKWQEDSTGGFYNPETGALTGRQAFFARMGKMKSSADAAEAQWLKDRIKKQTRSGTLLSPSLPNETEADFQAWKQKRFEPGILPFFTHHGTIFGKDTGLTAALTGRRPLGGGDKAEDEAKLRDIYNKARGSLYSNPTGTV